MRHIRFALVALAALIGYCAPAAAYPPRIDTGEGRLMLPSPVIQVDADGNFVTPGGGGGSGTEYTEDAAAAANPMGGVVICVRRDTLTTSEVSADDDNVAVKCDSKGELYIKATDTDTLIGAQSAAAWANGNGTVISLLKTVATAALDTSTPVPVSQSGTWNLTNISGTVSLPTGAATSANQATLHGYVDGLEGQVGIVTETAPANDTASSGLNGRLQRIAQNLTTILNDSTTSPVGGPAAHDAAISGNPVRVGGRALTANYAAVSAGDVADFITTTTGVQITRPYSLPGQQWSYAAASGGISNSTTAVTIQAAAGAGIKIYTTACQLSSDALGTATELALRDGAGGTVLWRMKIGTGGLVNGLNISFPSPLSGTANTLLEVVTLTASGTGAVFVNCQGYTAP